MSPSAGLEKPISVLNYEEKKRLKIQLEGTL